MDHQLLTYTAVVETSNFTKAAEILHTTQPAVSQQIAQLERKMGVKLLDRTNKRVETNRAGQIVYAYAVEIIRLYNHMQRLVNDLRDSPSGQLYIGASYTFGEYVLPRALALFCSVYPDIRPAITIANTHEVVESVANGQLDIGIIEGHSTNDNVQVEDFAEDTVVIVCSANHRLTRLNRIATPDDLANETWIVREKGSGTREVTDRTMEEYGIHPNTIMEFGSTQVIKEAVEAGLGITILSEWTIRKEIALQTLSMVTLGLSSIRRQFSIVTKKSEFQTKSTTLFQDFLHKHPKLYSISNTADD